jgi:catechol 2,3-dioxygenase
MAVSIDKRTHVGTVGLTVADLERSVGFYRDAIGLAEIRRAGREAVLGVGDLPLLALTEQPGALPWMVDGMTGLYHFAILLPTRAALGSWLGHYVRLGYPPPGQGDHIVSEALYLRDPDGHGIEMYADRPREGWQWADGQVRMGTGPVDVRGLLAQADPWSGRLPAGTTMGHVHLQVGDVPKARAFYGDLFGFDVVASMPTALFVSAGGYHHHLGLNSWHSQGAGPAPDDTASLRFYTVVFADEVARGEVVRRLEGAGLTASAAGSGVVLDDPWGNEVRLQVGERPG